MNSLIATAAFGSLLLQLLPLSVDAVSNPNPDKFLLVSAPRDGKVAYMRITKGGKIESVDAKVEGKMKTLVSGLVHPQGMAVEQHLKTLIVADPDAKQIIGYPLQSEEATLTAGARKVLAEDVEARWVATDGLGNVYFSDEPKNQILKLPVAQALRGTGRTLVKPQILFNSTDLSQVSSPGGVAVDSFRVYWANKQAGKTEGSIVAASDGTTLAQVKALAKNTEKSYGVCLAYSNVFYTQPESTVFGVKKSGGPTAAVTDRLTNPRGCSWDGDGTVYVADRGANAVFGFAANMNQIGAAEVMKIVDFEDAFGVAVFAAARRAAGPAFLLLPLLLLWPALVFSAAAT